MKQRLLSSSFAYKQQDPDYKGQKIDYDYTQDPVEVRPCRDLLCCILFLAFIGFMGYVAAIAFMNGKPELLAAPFDQDKKQCGVDEGYQNYKNVYISYLIANKTSINFLCVQQCPKTSLSQILCHPTSKVTSCDQLFVYQSQTAVNVCVPQVQITEFDFEYFNVSVLQEYFSDLRDARYLVLAMLGVAFVMSILYTILMRWFAGCFLWGFIILFITVLIVIGTVCLLLPQVAFLRQILNYDSMPDNLKNRDYQVGCAVICLVSAFIIFMVVCCMKRQIKISIGIIKAASDFVRNCCSSLLIPFYISIFQALFLAFWVIVMVYLFSSSNDFDPVGDTPFAMIAWNEDIKRLTIVYIFGLIWVMFFFEGLGAYWSSSTVAIWYFQSGEPSSPIIRSICRSVKSFGSIAFGSLLLAIVTVIRLILEYINTKAKKSTAVMNQGQAAAVNFAVKCAACLIACFERIIRFLTQNAYIMMAISGKSFCESARQSFYLLLRCAGQFAVSHGTTKFFIGLGKAFIITLCCVTGYIFITTIQPYKNQIYQPIFLTIIFAIVSYPIASAFMTLFQMAANTLLICYCIELDLAKGRSKCPPGLKNFLQQYIQSSSVMDQIENNR